MGNVHINVWGALVRPLLQWKSNEYNLLCGCVCNLSYPACNAYAPYYHLWPAPLHVFPHYLIKGKILGGKKLLDTKCVLIFSTTFVWNIFHSKKKWARYDENAYWSPSTRYSCTIVTKLEISGKFFEKYSYIKFHVNPFSGSRVVPFGLTDLMKLILAFRNFANAPKSQPVNAIQEDNCCLFWDHKKTAIRRSVKQHTDCIEPQAASRRTFTTKVRFRSTSFYVRYTVDELTLGQIFLREVPFLLPPPPTQTSLHTPPSPAHCWEPSKRQRAFGNWEPLDIQVRSLSLKGLRKPYT
jgi:hypothetical protein